MKHTLTGIFSGLLLICILLGNTWLTAYGNGLNHIQTAASIDQQEIKLPVLMYHHLLKDPARTGDYVITPTQFEQDLQCIKNQGYTTVSLQQIVDYYEKQQPLPEKPILITFDDGYETVHEYAFSLLQKYHMKAVVLIIGKYTDLYSGDVVKGLSYSHMNWEQLAHMQQSGLIEVGNHTYGLHSNDGGRKGIQKLNSESVQQYHQLLTEDIGSLNKEIIRELDTAVLGFAYPFGAYSPESNAILQELGFKVILTCEEKVNHLNPETHTQGDVILLNRFNRSGKYTTEEMFLKFKERKR